MDNTQNLSNETDIRKDKIKRLKEDGKIPFAEKFERTHTLAEARNLPEGTRVKIAGRIIFRRIMGKFGFVKIHDINGSMQVSVGRNELSEQDYEFYKKMIDIGDFIGVSGEVYVTQTGEKTVKAESVCLLSKAMRPLPEKFHGLTDIEARYRQRYLDLIASEESRKVLLGRSKIISFIRKYLEGNDFIEVETPILQGAVCGASAKPFLTKHNALDKICNLRIAPETYLKQLIAGGFDRVYEIGKCFRNEGMDTQHLQEFTMIEWYAAYWNFEDNITFVKGLLKALIYEVTGSLKLSYQGKEIDFSNEVWPRINYVERLREILGFDFLKCETAEELISEVVSRNIFGAHDFEGIKTLGGVVDFIYKKKIRCEIVQPTILYNYPACLVPLARRNDADEKIIDMFQIIVDGMELIKAYSELVDPIVQRITLEEQAKAKLGGDEEAMELDEDFVLAIEHGMPPISGLGMGIDRLVTVLYDLPSIRDAVLFPLMK